MWNKIFLCHFHYKRVWIFTLNILYNFSVSNEWFETLIDVISAFDGAVTRAIENCRAKRTTREKSHGGFIKQMIGTFRVSTSWSRGRSSVEGSRNSASKPSDRDRVPLFALGRSGIRRNAFDAVSVGTLFPPSHSSPKVEWH